MKKIVQKIIGKIKKEPYTLDDRVSSSYLLRMFIERFFMILRGFLSGVKNEGLLFIGKRTIIKSKKLLRLGKGVTIGNNCYLDGLSEWGIILGNNVSIGRNTAIECTGNLKHLGKGIVVKDNVGLGTDAFYGCAGGIQIGSNTIVGNYVSFHSENHNIDDLLTPIRLQGVNHLGINIGENCWIGAKVTILDGVNLGDGCVVAAGAVLKAGDYISNGIYGGVPARLLKMRT